MSGAPLDHFTAARVIEALRGMSGSDVLDSVGSFVPSARQLDLANLAAALQEIERQLGSDSRSFVRNLLEEAADDPAWIDRVREARRQAESGQEQPGVDWLTERLLKSTLARTLPILDVIAASDVWQLRHGDYGRLTQIGVPFVDSTDNAGGYFLTGYEGEMLWIDCSESPQLGEHGQGEALARLFFNSPRALALLKNILRQHGQGAVTLPVETLAELHAYVEGMKGEASSVTEESIQ